MKQAQTKPRDYAVETLVKFGVGKVGWRLDPDFARWSAHRQQRALWQLTAAVVQHEHAQAIRDYFQSFEPVVTLKGHCEKWGYDLVRAGAVLRGDTIMRTDDLAWMLRSIGPGALPNPSDLAKALDWAVESAVGSAGALLPEVPARIAKRQTTWRPPRRF